ncbi:MFS transporter [Streptomyces sioyaensis]|uniref:MFS transporter n=1 Tax=Streptomyces sioyaensis TaxID=67364 RepID=UPI001F2FD58B|nr:MFS transporter [Streptomyces sioyaensis]
MDPDTSRPGPTAGAPPAAQVAAPVRTAPGPVPRIPVPGLRFGLLATVQVLVNAGVTVTSTAGPAIERDLALSHAQLVLAGSAYGLAFSGLLLLGGRLTDLTDQRRAFILGAAVVALGSAAAAVSTGAGTLIATRFLAGCGAALAAPAAMALLGALFPGAPRRARAISLWGSLSSVGASAGILLSGVLVTLLTWRWVFGALAVVAAASALAAPRVLPRVPPPSTGRVDVAGAALATTGLGATGYGLAMAGTHGWSTVQVLVPLGAGILLLVAFAAVEKKIAQPLLPPRLLAPASRVIALLTSMIGPAGGASTAFLLSLYFQQVRGWSPLATASVFVPYSVVLAVTGLLSGRLADRVGARRLIPVGILATAAGLALISRLTPAGPLGVPLVLGLLVLPVGIALTVSGAVATAMAGVPARHAGLAAGVMNTALLTGATMGVAVLTSLADGRTAALLHATPSAAAVGGYAHAFALAAVAFLLAAVLVAAGLRSRSGGRHRR